MKSHGAPMGNGINDTLAERGSRYGAFADNALISQNLKGAIFEKCPKLLTPMQLEAIDMICHKLARIVCGDPNYADSWTDIAGYATLVANHLNGLTDTGEIKNSSDASNAGG